MGIEEGQLRICVLGSGSKGNSILIRSGQTDILLDAGLSARETERRLVEAGVEAAALGAICLTHEHKDHCGALAVLHGRYRTPLYANAGTIEGVMQAFPGARLDWNIFTTGAGFQLHDLGVFPFAVSHDAFEPVGFVVTCGVCCIGVLTDSGCVPDAAQERLRGCDLIVMEANHDEAMLQASGRPYALRRRIAGMRGHLSNRAAAQALCAVGPGRLREVLLTHISDDCNTPELAIRTVRTALCGSGMAGVSIRPTYRDRISDVVTIGALDVGVCEVVSA